MLRNALLILCFYLPLTCFAQSKPDSALADTTTIVQELNQAIKKTITNISNTTERPKLSVKSEEEYLPHNGKYVRRIYINRLGFNRRLTDTIIRNNIGTRIMSRLHITSREWVIRDNLFTDEGDVVVAYKIADNERYLRTLPWIQDSRIILAPVEGAPDSVDMIVNTKDILSIGGKLHTDPGYTRISLAENNFLGMGQKLELTGLYDQHRFPQVGSQVLYRKNNVKGSFIDATVGYSVMYPNKFDGSEEENTVFLQLDKVVVSPYSRFAGGFNLAYKTTKNRYTSRPDSLYYNYQSRSMDGWVGYNLASRKLLASNIRDRQFVSVRYAQNYFDKVPVQVGNRINYLFNDVQLALISFTAFKQNFYKTNYVYGFGITEDIPYGYNMSLTTGWYRQLALKRPYIGIKADGYSVSKKEDFFRYFFRLGSFYNKGLEDAGVLVGGSWFTRLMTWKDDYKFRQYIGLSYTHLFNTITTEPLRIDNPFGLQYFNYQYITGYDRISGNFENTVFMPYKVLGFKFAPFLNFNVSIITPPKQKFFKSDVYTGIGTGFRTRNENLVFGTVEVRCTYFPRIIHGVPAFKFSMTTNLRYKYASKYVTQPDLIRWNVDEL